MSRLLFSLAVLAVAFLAITTAVSAFQQSQQANKRDTKTIKKRCVEIWKSMPGKVLYMEDCDRQLAHHHIWVFDKDEYLAATGSSEKHVKGGTVSFRVTKVSDESVEPTNDPKHPEPHGGYERTYYHCVELEVDQSGHDGEDDVEHFQHQEAPAKEEERVAHVESDQYF